MGYFTTERREENQPHCARKFLEFYTRNCLFHEIFHPRDFIRYILCILIHYHYFGGGRGVTDEPV